MALPEGLFNRGTRFEPGISGVFGYLGLEVPPLAPKF